MSHKRSVMLIYTLVMAFFLYDITEDLLNSHFEISVLVEIVLFALIALLMLFEIRTHLALREQLQQERGMRLRLSGELRSYIEGRFAQWQLSPSEQEIGWMILHGYAFQEIAQARNTKEKTVRQQATSIYAKSSSANRAEFVALFLEDLLSNSEGLSRRAEA